MRSLLGKSIHDEADRESDSIIQIVCDFRSR